MVGFAAFGTWIAKVVTVPTDTSIQMRRNHGFEA